MRNVATLVSAFALITMLLFPASAAPKEIADPDKFSQEVVQIIATGDSRNAAKMIVETFGLAASAEATQITTAQNALQIFDGKTFNFTGKVLDNEFGKALRQIVQYAYVENLGFVYFRFNFKMTSKGWILAHFIFKTETQELFPKDFVHQ